MKAVFLFASFLPFIPSVHAREYSDYICQLNHKAYEAGFSLAVHEHKEVDVGEWKVVAGIERVENHLEVTLARSVDVLEASYRKESKQIYPLNAKHISVKLEHSFAGSTDVFNMACYPRDL